MYFFRNKKLKNISAIFLISVILFFGYGHFAFASITCILSFSACVVEIINVVAFGILSLSALILTGAGYFLDFALNPGLGFVNSSIVQLGWGIALSVANLFFILILLLIAFGFIFNIESFGAKQSLGKLIVAALLINFSLVIAGALVDFSQVVAGYFIEPLSSISTYIGGLMNFQKLLNPDTPASIPVGALSASIMRLSGTLISIIFSIVATFVFIAIGVAFLIRIVGIWMLLIISPIVWALWILPYTKKYWDEWWETFLKYLFFAPAAGFFLYISLAAFKGTIANMGEINLPADAGLAKGLLEQVGQGAVLIFLLLGSLIAAEKSGLAGVSAVTGFAKGMSKSVVGKISGYSTVKRYGSAIKDQFKKRESEKKDIVKARVEESRKGLSERRGLGWLKTPKENQKEKAQKRQQKADQIVQNYREGKVRFEDVQKVAGSKLGRRWPGTASVNALALVGMEKELKVSTGEVNKKGEPILRKNTPEEIKEFRARNYTKRQRLKVEAVERRQKRQIWEKSKAEKMWEDMVKEVKESGAEEESKTKEKPKTEEKKA